VSSIGLGSYLGQMDEPTDRAYVASVKAAVRGGINLIDTSLNYRHQRSELNIGEALADLFGSGEFRRGEVVVCTKAGYLVPGALPRDGVDPADIAGRMHCMSPAFLRDQLSRSLANLRLDCVDVFYLHNPETQLQHGVSPAEFYRRIETAFRTLEDEAAAGRICYYGTATWSGYRTPEDQGGLSLDRMLEAAEHAAGPHHRFRFIQLPLNLAMLEGVDASRRAAQSGLTAIASASILQTRLASGLPEQIQANLPGLTTDAQRAIQFARCAPGITAALVGMSNPAHVAENLQVGMVPPAPLTAWFRPAQ